MVTKALFSCPFVGQRYIGCCEITIQWTETSEASKAWGSIQVCQRNSSLCPMSLVWWVHIDTPQSLEGEYRTVQKEQAFSHLLIGFQISCSASGTNNPQACFVFGVKFSLSVVDGMWPISVHFSAHIKCFRLRILTTLDNLIVVYFWAEDMNTKEGK